MDTKTTHRWYESNSAGNHQGVVADEVTGKTIAITYELTDAAYIVRCVNELEGLVAGLQDMVNLLESQAGINRFADTAADIGRDLLARATQEG